MTKDDAIAILQGVARYLMSGNEIMYSDKLMLALDVAIDAMEKVKNQNQELNNSNDLISRAVAIDAFKPYADYESNRTNADWVRRIEVVLHDLPPAQPEQRYTEEELRVFAHGISLSLLSKRSAQHWRYDKDTATEIEFLERLYDKVSADMKGEQ